MKNPLLRRLPRELKQNIGKFLVIFLFMTVTIAVVSGFLVADNSLQTAYNESPDKYNQEDGHFVLEQKISDDLREELKEGDIALCELFYKEEDSGKNTYRIYVNREDMNLASVHYGNLATKKDEIAIDRVFANNNDIEIGDSIKIDGHKFEVCGLISLQDYSCLYPDNSNFMFDAQDFSIASVTQEGFDQITDNHLNYCYAWQWQENDWTKAEKKEHAEELMKQIAAGMPGQLKDFLPEFSNQAIHFAESDMGSDKSMTLMLLYIVIVIMAFVFAVTTSNTIEQESAVIGTLRAMGYTKAELIGHYMALPVIVTLIGAAIGNILGYTWLKDMMADLYYNSYSLPTYQTLWNAEAFVLTTVVPCVLMVVINLWILVGKFKISPLRFLRHDLGKKNKKKRVLRLPDIAFMRRFRMRVMLQNFSGYVIMFIGIIFSSLLLMFGMMMQPMLNHYADDVTEHMFCDYQYMLKAAVPTDNKDAEEYAAYSLETDMDGRETQDDISVYGVMKDSEYVTFVSEHQNMKNGVIVSNGILEKYGLKVGDELELKEPYGDEKYTLKIEGECEYPSSLAVFMDIDEFREMFDKDDDYFNGYFSNEKLDDIDEAYIAAVIEESDLLILSNQLNDSIGSMFPIFWKFALLMYMLIVYLLSKLILEKNALSISMVKILGYKNGEIAGLYLAATAIVVVVSVIVAIPLSYLTIKILWIEILSSYSGWVSFYMEPLIYLKMFALGILAYAVVGGLQFLKIKKVPMEEALKNAE